jgi:hypothetical protein
MLLLTVSALPGLAADKTQTPRYTDTVSGYYLRSSGIWAFNLESGDFAVPAGLGWARS